MKRTLIVIILVIALVLAKGSIYVVSEGEQAIITQFGAPVGDVKYAGLHFKIPVIQDVIRFDRRILKWDGDPNQIPTKDKKFIWIDTTARWRIVDPLLFYKTVATELGAQSRLDDIIDSVVRDAVSGRLLVELVRGSDYVPEKGASERFEIDGVEVPREQIIGREEILRGMLDKARASIPEYGIELIDIQIKRINYIEQVRRSVYERMINERKKVATQYRSEGEGEKADILGQMERELKEIRSEAQRQALEIRGRGDAEAAAIYAGAYNRDKEFYTFLRTLESYKKGIRQNSRLVISADSEFFRYLKEAK